MAAAPEQSDAARRAKSHLVAASQRTISSFVIVGDPDSLRENPPEHTLAGIRPQASHADRMSRRTWSEHGSTNRMGCSGSSTSPVTLSGVTIAGLLVLTLSGCTFLNSATSFSSLLPEQPPPKVPAGSTDSAVPSDQTPSSVAEAEEAATGTRPAVRLLNPQFNVAGPKDPLTENRTGGHSLSPDAAALRKLIGRRAHTPMMQENTLPDDAVEQSAVTFEESASDPQSAVNSSTITGAPGELQGSFETATLPAAGTPQNIENTTGAGESPDDAAATGSGQTTTEPSMLDRLRELYDPAPERRPTSMLRRQIRRLQTPWGILGNRDDPDRSARVDETAGDSGTTAEGDTVVEREINPLDALIQKTEQQLAAWPRSPGGVHQQPALFRQRQLDLRLLHLIANRPAAAIAAIDILSAEEQEFWQELMLGIDQFRSPDENLNYDQQAARTIGQLRAAVQHLEPSSSLTLRRLEICSRIHGFGSIETFPANDFDPGDRVLIYVEVGNLHSELSPGQNYRTVFSGSLQIFAESSDEPVESFPLPAVEDESSSRRTDYFQSYEITLPAHLLSGAYRMRLQLQDDLTSRRATGTLDFTIR